VSARYIESLDPTRGINLYVEFTTHRSDVLDYAVVLVLEIGEERETVRVYDGAHGRNEMHRYTRPVGKQPALIVHRGTLGEGMRAAIKDVKRRYLGMIESWETQ
jgi:hypothetical protein